MRTNIPQNVYHDSTFPWNLSSSSTDALDSEIMETIHPTLGYVGLQNYDDVAPENSAIVTYYISLLSSGTVKVYSWYVSLWVGYW